MGEIARNLCGGISQLCFRWADKLSEKLRLVWEIGNANQGGYDADKKNV